MRRADRLFQIVQILRRSSPVTAAQLAAELEVTPRTVYRDMADLMAQRVPVRGEAGFGYVLDDEFDMPPLMLTADEVEAAVLGAQWVATRGDSVLANAARDLLAKISAAVPEKLRPFVAEPSIGAAGYRAPAKDGLDMARTREWIRSGRKLRLRYSDDQGRETSRTVWPVMIGYADSLQVLAAWCELRGAFRHFRTDRVLEAEFLDARHGRRPSDLRRDWSRSFEAERGFAPGSAVSLRP
jgi:predicted DNA-binding transcriptional regulator YafY